MSPNAEPTPSGGLGGGAVAGNLCPPDADKASPRVGPGWREGAPRLCSIADALGVVGDRYALLILRELEFGVTRFSDILHNTGAPRETLTTRLRQLEEAGLLERRRYSEHPPRDEYFTTPAGSAIQPVLRELRRWGETYVTPTPGGS